MKGKKNDYSMSFYNGDTRVLFLKFVHNTDKAEKWVDSKSISWTHANVYERRTEKFLSRLYNKRTTHY